MNIADTLGIIMDFCENAIVVCKLGSASTRTRGACVTYLQRHGTFDGPGRTCGPVTLHTTSKSPESINIVFYLMYQGTRYVFDKDMKVYSLQVSPNSPASATGDTPICMFVNGLSIDQFTTCVRVYKNNLVLLKSSAFAPLHTRWGGEEPMCLSYAAEKLAGQLVIDSMPTDDYIHDWTDPQAVW